MSDIEESFEDTLAGLINGLEGEEATPSRAPNLPWWNLVASQPDREPTPQPAATGAAAPTSPPPPPPTKLRSVSRRSRPAPPATNHDDPYDIYAAYPGDDTPPPAAEEEGEEEAASSSKPGPKKGYRRPGTQARVAQPAAGAYYKVSVQHTNAVSEMRKKALAHVARIEETDDGEDSSCVRCTERGYACRRYTEEARKKFRCAGCARCKYDNQKCV